MMIYTNNEQLVLEIKKMLLEQKTSQSDVARAFNITPQSVNAMLKKQGLSFVDVKKICDVAGVELEYRFIKKGR